MLGPFSEQLLTSSQPMNNMFAANVKLLEQMSQQQTELLSGVITDSMKLMHALSAPTDAKDVLAAQSVYAQSLRERMTSASKLAYNTMSSMGQQVGSAVQSGLASSPVASTSPTVAPKATEKPKKAAAKKAAPKAATKTSKAAATPAVKAAAKPIVKAEAKPDTASSTKPVSKAVEAPAKAPVVAKTAAPVASLTADDVKAPKSTSAASTATSKVLK